MIGVFLVAIELFFSCFFVATAVPMMWRQCFVFCHDNVAIEVPLSRPRRPRKEVRVATGAWSRPRDFVSRQDFTEWCCDRVFYVATGYFCVVIEVGLRQEILCRDRVWPGQEFSITTECF